MQLLGSLLLSLAAASANPVQAADSSQPTQLVVVCRAGSTELGLAGGAPFHRTPSEVRDVRSVALPGSGGLAVIWTEVGASGAATPWYAILPDRASAATVRATSYEIAMVRASFDPLVALPDFTAHGLVWDGEVYLVQFVTQVLGEHREALAALGATTYDHIVHNTLIVRMTPRVRARVQALDCVRWTGAFHPELRVEPGVLAALADGSLSSDQLYDVSVFERGEVQMGLVAARIRAMGGQASALHPEGFRFEARLDPARLVAVLGMPEVASVGRRAAAGADMNLVREFSGANYLEMQTGFSGQGVRGEVFDIGVDASHPDLQHHGGVLFHGPTGTSAHGTSTTGIVFGDGTSNPAARGMLPNGKIVFGYSPPFLNSGAGNRYAHTAELIDPSLPYQCVFQSNSTGSSRTFYYNSISAEMDDILFHNDIVLLQAQGNSGNPESRPEAWAKNIVSVGGIHHGGTLSINDDFWAGASGGPATDGRIKPDLAHFYDDIFTITSGGYATFGGTSASTPIIAGLFGLFFQMWHNDIWGNAPTGATVFDSRPSSRLARAAVINTAMQWPFSGTNHNLTRVHQGWGAADAKNLYDTRNTTFWIDETDLVGNLATNAYDLDVAAGTPAFKATLVYRDPKGVPFSTVHRINDLSLRVTSPGGVAYWGNHGLEAGNWSTSGGSANTLDVVENVFVPAPEAGVWRVEVIGSDINTDIVPSTPENDADYALWVTGVATTPCSPPIAYCTAKTTSIGTTPSIGSTGSPSVVTQDFRVTLNGAMPSSTANIFWGMAPAAIPFAGGLLCVAPPVLRGPPSTTSAGGADDFPVTVVGAMIGQTFYYQWWFRDTGFAPPGAIGMSDALQVTFCNS